MYSNELMAKTIQVYVNVDGIGSYPDKSIKFRISKHNKYNDETVTETVKIGDKIWFVKEYVVEDKEEIWLRLDYKSGHTEMKNYNATCFLQPYCGGQFYRGVYNVRDLTSEYSSYLKTSPQPSASSSPVLGGVVGGIIAGVASILRNMTIKVYVNVDGVGSYPDKSIKFLVSKDNKNTEETVTETVKVGDKTWFVKEYPVFEFGENLWIRIKYKSGQTALKNVKETCFLQLSCGKLFYRGMYDVTDLTAEYSKHLTTKAQPSTPSSQQQTQPAPASSQKKETPKPQRRVNYAQPSSETEHVKMGNKEQVMAAYRKLVKILDGVSHDIKEIDGVNSQFDTIQNKVASVIDSKIAEVKKECDDSLNMTVWDKLVIAFFGTTNAGKSTIIETFRILFDDKRKKEDGLIVGDGQSDFTKTYDEYQLKIDGVPFTLIDVPGIEGNEDEFQDKIRTALHKAHIVFYIQGENKKPDTATAQKIKKYLGDWVKVYSIYNVRGGVTNYDEEEERETLLTEGVLKAERLMKETFKGILGNVYAGHITLQAFLAMCAKACFSPKREDLIRNQRKLLKLFPKGADEVLAFSQFASLVNLVKERSTNFTAEIMEANKQKLVSMAGRIEKEISATEEAQKESVTQLENQLREFNNVVNGFKTTQRNISNRVKNEIARSYSTLCSELCDLVDETEDSNRIKGAARNKQNEMKQNLTREINNIVNTHTKQLEDKAKRKKKDLDGVSLPNIQFEAFRGIDTNIDFDGAIENLDVDFGDFLNCVGSTAGAAATGAAIGSFIPGIGTLFGAGIGAVVGFLGNAGSGDGGKADAKREIGRVIDQGRDKAIRKAEEKLQPLMKVMENRRRELQSAITEELNNLDDFSDAIDNTSLQLKSYVNSLKHSQYGKI